MNTALDQYTLKREQSMTSCDPTIGVHDRFDQQSKSLEFSEIEIFHSLVEATINPVTVAFLKDREVLIKRLTPDAVGEAVVMQVVGGLQLQAHAFSSLQSWRGSEA